jgi:hypothetical protein
LTVRRGAARLILAAPLRAVGKPNLQRSIIHDDSPYLG